MTIIELVLAVIVVGLYGVILWQAGVHDRELRKRFDDGYALAERHAAEIRSIDRMSARIDARIELLEEMRRANAFLVDEETAVIH